MGYSEENGEVVLRLSRADYEAVLLALGIATGLTAKDGFPVSGWVELVNRLNQGNPNFQPYATGDGGGHD
jgi:hypothetical protein